MSFQNFITKILLFSPSAKKHIPMFIKDDNLPIFRKAFITKTKNPQNNYEYLETIGDVKVNDTTTQYISNRWKDIQNIVYYTKIRHQLVSKESLSTISYDLGFGKHILVSDNEKNTLHKGLKTLKGRDIFEDVFEAFFGALNMICLKEKRGNGLGYTITYEILAYIYDGKEISTNYEDLFDPMSRLKEYYDELGLELADYMQSSKNIYTQHPKVIIFDKDGKYVAHGEDEDMKKSRKQAARLALKTLKVVSDKYPKISKPATIPTKNIVDDSFKNFIGNLLKRSRVKPKKIKSILKNKDNLIFFEKAFNFEIDRNRNFEFQRAKFFGDVILDDVAVYYFLKRFPSIQNEQWVSKLKHYVMKNKLLGKKAKDYGFQKFVFVPKIAEKTEDELNMLKKSEKRRYHDRLNVSEEVVLNEVYKAFCGQLMLFFNNIKLGLGYTIVYNFIASTLNDINIPTTYQKLFDPITRLKNLFSSKKWKFKDLITCDRIVLEKDVHSEVEVSIYAYLLGNKKPIDSNKIKLVTVRAQTKKDAENKAAGKAINILSKIYRIMEIPLIP